MFTKLHDRRIPKVIVGVGVGPMEFKLYGLSREDVTLSLIHI